MFKYLFLFFFIYFGYQLVFRFILPLFRATTLMQQKVNQMNAQRKNYEQQGYQQASDVTGQQQKVEKEREKEGEYIDFEEIK